MAEERSLFEWLWEEAQRLKNPPSIVCLLLGMGEQADRELLNDPVLEKFLIGRSHSLLAMSPKWSQRIIDTVAFMYIRCAMHHGVPKEDDFYLEVPNLKLALRQLAIGATEVGKWPPKEKEWAGQIASKTYSARTSRANVRYPQLLQLAAETLYRCGEFRTLHRHYATEAAGAVWGDMTSYIFHSLDLPKPSDMLDVRGVLTWCEHRQLMYYECAYLRFCLNWDNGRKILAEHNGWVKD